MKNCLRGAGETDFLRPYGTELLESCIKPMIIHHPKGHTIPRLDPESLKTTMSFIKRIKDVVENEQ
ncbi:hypothetical protein Ahy_A08g038486 isoform C [Arachis hypogaea]|uniref:Serine hydrolase FSH domain-containing protein n=1 Tax=Arachis hypogaea TaxID=3818 RepID=A0A445BTU4_ARAHY|nr:hypothetical protein Ahy_A08g038486 isoform C [Arachis hypogaea]